MVRAQPREKHVVLTVGAGRGKGYSFPSTTSFAEAWVSLSERLHGCEVGGRAGDCIATEPARRVNALMAVSHTNSWPGLMPRKNAEQTFKRRSLPTGTLLSSAGLNTWVASLLSVPCSGRL